MTVKPLSEPDLRTDGTLNHQKTGNDLNIYWGIHHNTKSTN